MTTTALMSGISNTDTTKQQPIETSQNASSTSETAILEKLLDEKVSYDKIPEDVRVKIGFEASDILVDCQYGGVSCFPR